MNIISKEEVERKLGTKLESVTEQEFLNIIVGDPQTLEKPDTLRGLVGKQMAYGSLQSTVNEGLKLGLPYRAIYASANAIHCPEFDELAGREWAVWQDEIKALLQDIVRPYQPQAPPVTVEGEEFEFCPSGNGDQQFQCEKTAKSSCNQSNYNRADRQNLLNVI